MTRAYSPSYGKPLSVPQGIIGLMTRFGMDVTTAHPEGYDLIPDVVEVAKTMLKHLAVASVRSPAWKKRSKMQTSFIRSHGHLTK